MIKIPLSEPDLTQLERSYLLEAFDSGWISSKGAFVERFEQQFAQYIGRKHAIACCNGTTALQLAYLACGMGQKPITVPSNTFAATLHMAQLTSDKVNEVDCDPRSWLIDLDLLKDWEGFIIAVHLYGNPVNMDVLPKLHSILIEDCAQSIGSEFRGKKCGTFGLVSTFSFYGNKTLTTGEGGMACTDDPKIAERMRQLRNHCMTQPYQHTGIGFNYKMTNLQAAIGLAQLERIDELIEKKQAITRWYERNLSSKFKRQRLTRSSKVVRWMNAYQHENAVKIRQKLEEAGIETRPGFIGTEFITFPSGTKLTKDQVETVCKAANAAA